MIEFLGKLPWRPAIAVSGGPDSMAILNFLSKKSPLVLYFDHGTEHGAEAKAFVKRYCIKHGLELKLGLADRERTKDESPEEYWRNMRYSFFSNITELPIITCHNLDDQVEQWIFSSLNGKPNLIPYCRTGQWNTVIRPFLITKKIVLEDWCKRKSVPYLTDPSNSDYRYQRSYIRHELVPRALKVNPGLHKVVKKKIVKEFSNLESFV